ncbi:hypothetical protein NA57DRAFT_53580 [Rhizodiscina lignyota]|uniref:Uncharacterized protein n=1 Tax=Rhizodiscina lignyota TaxID=1504668 RepID=A0A9P4IP02_9PEZI|nr:hypothetical protein NA57DRAFT_53580 [Rhizodiscina lignyota]
MGSISVSRTLVWRVLNLILLASNVTARSTAPPITTISPSGRPGGYSNSSCAAECDIQFPDIVEYTWSSVFYNASTTTDVTVATLIYIVNNATNQTSTSTEYAHPSVTANYPTPGKPARTTLTIDRGPGSTVTTVITWPTPFIDYGANYTIQDGHLSTGKVCKTFDFDTIVPPSHPSFPIPTSLIQNSTGDRLGSYHVLVPAEFGADDIDTSSFISWYQTQFSAQAPVASCTFAITAPEASAPSFSVPGPESSQSPLTHTSVQYLTSTTTSHVNIPTGSPTRLPESNGYGGGGSPPAKTTSKGLGGALGGLIPSIIGNHGSGNSGSSSGHNGEGSGSSQSGQWGGSSQSGSSSSESASSGSSSSGGSSSGSSGEGSGSGQSNNGGAWGSNGDSSSGSSSSGSSGSDSQSGSGSNSNGGGNGGSSSSEGSGPAIVVGHSNVPVTPTAVATTVNGHATSIPAIIADGHTIALDGARVNVQGTPVRLTVVSSGSSSVTEAVIGYGGGAFGGAVQSSVPISFPVGAAETSSGLGGAIMSGLGGPGGQSPTGSSTSSSTASPAQFTGAAPVAVDGRASLFGLVVAAVVGMMV